MNVRVEEPAAKAAADRAASRRGQPGTRQCAISRQRLPKEALVRLVLGPEGTVAIDLLEKAPGRGLYVRAERAVVEKALAGKGIGRTFRGRARIMAAVEVEALIDGAVDRLHDRLIELASIARRAQVAALGMDSVLVALADNPPAPVVLTTQDVSERSLRKVREAAGSQTRFVSLKIGKADLGSKLGRKDVGVVAIRPSALAKRLVAEAERRDGLGTPPHSRAREAGLNRDNGEPGGGRNN